MIWEKKKIKSLWENLFVAVTKRIHLFFLENSYHWCYTHTDGTIVTEFSPNRPTGPIWSSSHNVRPLFVKGLHEYSKDFPRGFIHHDTPKAFSQIFIITYLLDQFSCSRLVHAHAHASGGWAAGWPSGALSAATALWPPVVSYKMVRRCSPNNGRV